MEQKRSLVSYLFAEVHDEIERRLCAWALGEPQNPARFVAHLTENCNLKCLYCTGIQIDAGCFPKELLKRENEVSHDEWVRIAKEAAELGVKHWSICGGEPLMRAQTLMDMIRTIKDIKPDSMIELNSNGSLFTDEIIETLVLFEVDILQLSIDGATAETHDFLRGKEGCFESITSAGRKMSALKRRLGKQKPYMQINTVINARNYAELPKFPLLAHSMGVEQIIANPMRGYDDNLYWIEKYDLAMSDDQIRELRTVWDEVEDAGRQLGIETSTGVFGETNIGEEKVRPKKDNPGGECCGAEGCHEGGPESANPGPETRRAESRDPQPERSDPPVAEDGRPGKERSDPQAGPGSRMPEGPRDGEAAPEEPKSEEDVLRERVGKFLDAYCFAPFYSISVGGIGDVGRCASAIRGKNRYFIQGKNLKDVWFGEYFEEARRLCLENKPVGDECDHCGVVTQRYILHRRLADRIGRKRPSILTHKRGRILEKEEKEEQK